MAVRRKPYGLSSGGAVSGTKEEGREGLAHLTRSQSHALTPIEVHLKATFTFTEIALGDDAVEQGIQ